MKLWGRRQKQQGAGATLPHLDGASIVESGIDTGSGEAVKGVLVE